MRMMDLLQIYEETSGQCVNVLKSSVFFSINVSQENIENICHTLQKTGANENSKYLGLLSVVGRNKSSVLGFLKDKVEKKGCFLGKKVGCLGRGGKF